MASKNFWAISNIKSICEPRYYANTLSILYNVRSRHHLSAKEDQSPNIPKSPNIRAKYTCNTVQLSTNYQQHNFIRLWTKVQSFTYNLLLLFQLELLYMYFLTHL